MATEIRTGIRLTGDASGMNAAFASGEKGADALDRKVDAAAKSSDRLTSALKTVGHYGTALVGATAAWNLGKQAISIADDMTVLQSRLKLVTANSAEMAAVQARLFNIAQQSRVSNTELGATYAQIARATSELGISQNRLLGVTQTIGQAMAISGGSAESMNAALIQLSQGLASGTLRGEELNSIMEQTPRLAQAIAQGMGVSLGQLRALGAEGKLTATSVIEALEKAAPALAREFAQVAPTISGSFETLKNATGLFVHEFDKATGSSASLAGGLKTVASGVQGLAGTINANKDALSILVGGVTGAVAIGAVATGLARLGPAIGIAGAALAANPALLALLGIGAAGAGALYAASNTLDNRANFAKNEVGNIERALAFSESVGDKNAAAKLRARLAPQQTEAKALQAELALRSADDPYAAGAAARESNRFSRVVNPDLAPFPGAKPLSEVRKYAKLSVDIQREAQEQSLDITKSYQNSIKLATTDTQRVALTKEMNDRLLQVDKDAKRELKTLGEQGAAEAKQLAEAQMAKKIADIELGAAIDRRDLADRERTNEQLYKLGLLDVNDYYTRKAALQLEDLELSEKVTQAELKQAQALVQSARKQEDKFTATARALGLERELVELDARKRAAAAEPGQQLDLRQKAEADKLREEVYRQRLKSTVDGYGQAEQLEAENRRLQMEAIRDPNARARAQLNEDLARRKSAISDITDPDAREKATDAFNTYVVLQNDALSDRLKPGWEKMLEGWRDTASLMRESYDTAFGGMLRDGEDEFVRSKGNILSTAHSMTSALENELLRLVYRKSMASITESLGNAFLGGADGILGGGGKFDIDWSWFGAKHTGGIVGGDGGMSRQVSPSVFSGARRYHSGGIVDGEVPIIAKRGEGVFTPGQMAALGGMGGGQAVSVNVQNFLGTEATATVEQRQTSDGTMVDVILRRVEASIADNIGAGSGGVFHAMSSRFGLATAVN